MTVKTDDAAKVSPFTALADEWDTLLKSMGAADCGDDDKKKTEGGDGAGDGGAGGDGAAGGDGDGDDTFGKALTVTLEDGSKVEAFDGTAMMKALHDENVVLRGKVEQLTANNESFAKAMTSAAGAFKAQGEMLKSMKDTVDRIGASGAGRRSVVTVTDKKVAGEGGKSGVDAGELMAKAMTLFEAGKLSGGEVNAADARILRGQSPDAAFVAKVMAAA